MMMTRPKFRENEVCRVMGCMTIHLAKLRRPRSSFAMVPDDDFAGLIRGWRLDRDYAMTVDLSNPGIMLTHRGSVLLLADGHHRMYRALQERRAWNVVGYELLENTAALRFYGKHRRRATWRRILNLD